MNIIQTTRYLSPAGELAIGSYQGQICICDWTHGRNADAIGRQAIRHLDATLKDETSDVIAEAICQLDEYFSGRRHEFDIPVLLTGTDFQRSVRRVLMRIPYGTTVSYAEVARRIGKPAAVRAAASAIASNPVSILVPCHRVVGSDGSLTGYAGGLDAKRCLLTLEGAL